MYKIVFYKMEAALTESADKLDIIQIYTAMRGSG